MGIEIERKFLVRHEGWRAGVQRKARTRQGYLCNNQRSSVRVRIMGAEGRLNIKGATLGIRRIEHEYPLPLDEARELLEKLCDGVIEKTRYFVPCGQHIWEIDVFGGQNEGLVVAEIELEHEDEVFERPDWLGEEVSDDPRYYNVMLIEHPFCEW